MSAVIFKMWSLCMPYTIKRQHPTRLFGPVLWAAGVRGGGNNGWEKNKRVNEEITEGRKRMRERELDGT